MRLLADEQIPRVILAPLREAGHDVVHILDARPGSPDESVLEMALSEERILLTEDRDFGELIFRDHVPASGVVFIRMKPSDMKGKIAAVLALIEREGSNLLSRYTVLEADNIRMRPILRTI